MKLKKSSPDFGISSTIQYQKDLKINKTPRKTYLPNQAKKT
jgi:hypothetical protein